MPGVLLEEELLEDELLELVASELELWLDVVEEYEVGESELLLDSVPDELSEPGVDSEELLESNGIELELDDDSALLPLLGIDSEELEGWSSEEEDSGTEPEDRLLNEPSLSLELNIRVSDDEDSNQDWLEPGDSSEPLLGIASEELEGWPSEEEDAGTVSLELEAVSMDEELLDGLLICSKYASTPAHSMVSGQHV